MLTLFTFTAVVICNLGGFGAWSIVISAFIADTSTPSNRSMRYGMLKLSETLGKPLGALLGNYILNEGNYLWNYLSLMLLFVDMLNLLVPFTDLLNLLEC